MTVGTFCARLSLGTFFFLSGFWWNITAVLIFQLFLDIKSQLIGCANPLVGSRASSLQEPQVLLSFAALLRSSMQLYYHHHDSVRVSVFGLDWMIFWTLPKLQRRARMVFFRAPNWERDRNTRSYPVVVQRMPTVGLLGC